MAQPFGFYQNLTDSEKTYVKIASVFFPLLLLILGFYIFAQGIHDVERQVDSYKDSLKLISVAGPTYLSEQELQENSTNHKKLDEETLKNNTIKLTSFIAGIANSIDLPIATYDENDVPYDSGDKSKIIIERTLSFDVREADLSKIMTLMERVENSEKPVYIKHYILSKYGSQPGKVRAKIVVATFLMTEKAS